MCKSFWIRRVYEIDAALFINLQARSLSRYKRPPVRMFQPPPPQLDDLREIW
jgi:hypothetical protein